MMFVFTSVLIVNERYLLNSFTSCYPVSVIYEL